MKDAEKQYRRERPRREENTEELSEGVLEGRNAVTEALRSGRTIDKVFVAAGDTDRGLARLAAEAKAAGAVVNTVDRRKLDQMSVTHAHQGIIAMAAAHEYATIDDMLALARERGEAPLIVICDELTDPHNLGAILRTAECAGAHGVIIPKRRSVGQGLGRGRGIREGGQGLQCGRRHSGTEGKRRLGLRHRRRRGGRHV